MGVEISNFSLGEDEYASAAIPIYVNLVDYAHNITTASGTYFEIDGTSVSGTFSPLTISGSVGAYRMSYDPADDFSSLMGPTTFTVHALNDIGETSEKDYYLTYGYKVKFNNFDMDFGYGTQVVVRIVAENLASCPKKDSTAYWFETRQQYSKDLSCSIESNPIGELSASIYPQSTAYFYGQTYRVVVTAKDFSGNEMETFILVYTIENEN